MEIFVVIIAIVVLAGFVSILAIRKLRIEHNSYQSPFVWRLEQQISIRDNLDKTITEIRWVLVAKPGDTEMQLQLERLERWRARTIKRIEPLKLLEEQSIREAEERRNQMHLVSAA